ncbi:MAG: flagellar biosynthetic protein FliO [Desulfobacteraceae bacterium]|nr:flagellar biosynthetic protein FliO [Desulfobacteraceae bacterium]
MEYGLELLRLAGSLALVLGLFLACMYALKRWGVRVRRPSPDQLMEIVAKQSFGPRHHLMLIRVPGQQSVLVGISPQNMSLMPVTTDSPEKTVPQTVENS